MGFELLEIYSPSQNSVHESWKSEDVHHHVSDIWTALQTNREYLDLRLRGDDIHFYRFGDERKIVVNNTPYTARPHGELEDIVDRALALLGENPNADEPSSHASGGGDVSPRVQLRSGAAPDSLSISIEPNSQSDLNSRLERLENEVRSLSNVFSRFKEALENQLQMLERQRAMLEQRPSNDRDDSDRFGGGNGGGGSSPSREPHGPHNRRPPSPSSARSGNDSSSPEAEVSHQSATSPDVLAMPLIRDMQTQIARLENEIDRLSNLQRERPDSPLSTDSETEYFTPISSPVPSTTDLDARSDSDSLFDVLDWRHLSELRRREELGLPSIDSLRSDAEDEVDLELPSPPTSPIIPANSQPLVWPRPVHPSNRPNDRVVVLERRASVVDNLENDEDQELAALERRLNALRDAPVLQQSVSTQQMLEKQREAHELETKALNSHLQKAQDEIRHQSSRIEDLNKQLKASEARLLESYQRELNSNPTNTPEYTALQTQLSQAQSAHEAAIQKARDLQTAMDQMAALHQQQMSELQSSLEEQTQRADALVKQLHASTEQQNAALVEQRKLSAQLEKARQDLSISESAHASEVTKLTSANTELQAKLQRAHQLKGTDLAKLRRELKTEHEAQIAELQKRIRDAEQAQSLARESEARAKKELRELDAANRDQLAEINAHLHALSKQNAALITRNQELEFSLAQERTASARAANLESALNDAQKKIRDLEANLKSKSHSSEEIQALQAELRKAKKDLQQLSLENSLLQASERRIKKLHLQLENARREAEAFIKDNEAQLIERGRLEAQRELQARFAIELQAQKEALERRIRALESERNTLASENQKRGDALSESEKTVAQLRSTKEDVEELQRLKTDIDKRHAKLQDLAQETLQREGKLKAKHQKEMQALEDEKKQLEIQIQALQIKLHQSEENHRGQVEAIRSELQKESDARETADQHMLRSFETTSRQRDRIQELEAELDTSREEIAALNTKLEQVQLIEEDEILSKLANGLVDLLSNEDDDESVDDGDLGKHARSQSAPAQFFQNLVRSS